ncbi:hypothetical protein D9M72_614660 [compost metagenome]
MRRRLFGFGNQHQFGEVSLLQRGATEIIEQQALGDGHQECPRFAGFLQFLAPQQAHESVLAQVFGPLWAGDIASKPGQ